MLWVMIMRVSCLTFHILYLNLWIGKRDYKLVMIFGFYRPKSIVDFKNELHIKFYILLPIYCLLAYISFANISLYTTTFTGVSEPLTGSRRPVVFTPAVVNVYWRLWNKILLLEEFFTSAVVDVHLSAFEMWEILFVLTWLNWMNIQIKSIKFGVINQLHSK